MYEYHGNKGSRRQQEIKEPLTLYRAGGFLFISCRRYQTDHLQIYSGGVRILNVQLEGSKTETYKTAMKSVIKSSPFERAMKVEAELNKLHGRIIKQLDSIKAYELEDRRLQLAEKQLELNKQKLTGEFEIDPDGSTENDEITDVVDDV